MGWECPVTAKNQLIIRMKRSIILFLSLIFMAACCPDKKCDKTNAKSDKKEGCGISCMAKNKSGELSCKLSAPEMRERKETVLASLKKQVLERKTLENGYAYKFPGSDKMLDELTEFIKTERQCCDFFVFNLSISGDKSEIWLELTGVEGAKEFIDGELAI